MSSEWQTVKLKDIADLKGGYAFKSGEYTEEGVFVLRTLNIEADGSIIKDGAKYVSRDSAEQYDRFSLTEWDTLFVMVGATLGKTGLVRKCDLPALLNQNMWVIRSTSEQVNPRYLHYAFREESKSLLGFASGAARDFVRRDDFRNLELRLPPKDTQDRISRFVGAIDDKIQLNHQINQTLEQMAQAIFKSWFVDFEPVKAKIAALEAGGSEEDALLAAMQAISGKDEAALTRLQAEQPEQYAELRATAELFPSAMQDSELGEIPDGWHVSPLGNFLTIKRGGSPRPIKDYIVPTGYPWTKIADATANDNPYIFKTKEFIKAEGLKKTTYLKRGTLILSNSATPGLPRFLALDACIHDGWLHFPQTRHFTDSYLYQLFLQIRKHLVSQGNGSVFTNLKTDILRNQLVLVPPAGLVQIFDKQGSRLLEVVKTKSEENDNLSELRDTLLPKLLFGELSVKESEVHLAEATESANV